MGIFFWIEGLILDRALFVCGFEPAALAPFTHEELIVTQTIKLFDAIYNMPDINGPGDSIILVELVNNSLA